MSDRNDVLIVLALLMGFACGMMCSGLIQEIQGWVRIETINGVEVFERNDHYYRVPQEPIELKCQDKKQGGKQ